ncbi:MAG TPA: hypothetical protein ENH82_20520 [bacterium]|nr:hypothetical protein [bacterium]
MNIDNPDFQFIASSCLIGYLVTLCVMNKDKTLVAVVTWIKNKPSEALSSLIFKQPVFWFFSAGLTSILSLWLSMVCFTVVLLFVKTDLLDSLFLKT